MEANQPFSIFRVDGNGIRPSNREVVCEYPLRLKVNGRDLATLTASPHQLNFLVVGFLRLQGFLDSLDDLQSLGICADFGQAEIRLRRHLPDQLTPTLTSGCGTGITFNLAESPGQPAPVNTGRRFTPGAITDALQELGALALNYRSHGGIHSAAVSDGRDILLWAEDIGRHNTLDRIAGEALFKGIDLAGSLLVTSGRVSTEMAAKAARLGIAMIASRTSPTDQAIRLCEAAGITLAGYVRGGGFEVFCHPEQLDLTRPAGRLKGVTGVILAGGSSLRMGSDKALLPHRGGRFIETIHRELAAVFPEVLVVTSHPEFYDFLPCRKVADLYPGLGALAGIHAGLHHTSAPRIFAVGCDMPYLNRDLIRHLAFQAAGHDVVIPESPRGLEPLHALYGRSCLPAIEEALAGGEKKIVSFFQQVRVKKVTLAEVAGFDHGFASFRNINTPEEYFGLREGESVRKDSHSRIFANGQKRNAG